MRPPESAFEAMLILLIILHVIVCLFLVGVVLLQQSKSGDVAAAFGGQGSQTAFGPRGATTLLTKLTAWAAVIFMFTSIGLTVTLSRTSNHSIMSGFSQPAKK
jgi:preprotein translocase subunit SecG